MTNIEKKRSITLAIASFIIRFAETFVFNIIIQKDLISDWQMSICSACEWIATILLILSVIIALIDDLSHKTFAHILSILIMSIIINALLVVLVNISIGFAIGLLIVFAIFTYFEMNVGGPFTVLIGFLLSTFGILAPIFVILLSIASILGLGMVF